MLVHSALAHRTELLLLGLEGWRWPYLLHLGAELAVILATWPRRNNHYLWFGFNRSHPHGPCPTLPLLLHRTHPYRVTSFHVLLGWPEHPALFWHHLHHGLAVIAAPGEPRGLGPNVHGNPTLGRGLADWVSLPLAEIHTRD